MQLQESKNELNLINIIHFLKILQGVNTIMKKQSTFGFGIIPKVIKVYLVSLCDVKSKFTHSCCQSHLLYQNLLR